MNVNGLNVFSSSYDIYGNASVSEAEIVIVTDIPVYPECQKSNISLINQIWRDHLILVENEASGKLIRANQNYLTYGLKVQPVVKGWDFPSLSPKIQQFLQQEVTIKQFRYEIDYYLKMNDFGLYQEEILRLLKTLMMVFTSDKLDQQAAELFNQLTLLPYFMRAQKVYALVRSIQGEFQLSVKEYHKAIFPIRQQFLKQSLENNLRCFKKVLVCLNANHVIRNPKLLEKEYDIKGIEDYLKTKKFVIINIKNRFLNLPQNMPQLWQPQHHTVPSWLAEWNKEWDQEKFDYDQQTSTEKNEHKSCLPSTAKPLSPQFILNRVKEMLIFKPQQANRDNQGVEGIEKNSDSTSICSLYTSDEFLEGKDELVSLGTETFL